MYCNVDFVTGINSTAVEHLPRALLSTQPSLALLFLLLLSSRLPVMFLRVARSLHSYRFLLPLDNILSTPILGINPRIQPLSPLLVIPQRPRPKTPWNILLINRLQTYLLLQISRPILGINPANLHRFLHLELC